MPERIVIFFASWMLCRECSSNLMCAYQLQRLCPVCYAWASESRFTVWLAVLLFEFCCLNFRPAVDCDWSVTYCNKMLDNRSQSYQSYELGHGAYGMRYGHLREVVIEKPHRKFCGLQRERHKWEGPPKESYPDAADTLTSTLHFWMVANCSWVLCHWGIPIAVSVRRLSDSAGDLLVVWARHRSSQNLKQPDGKQFEVLLCFVNLFLILAVLAVVRHAVFKKLPKNSEWIPPVFIWVRDQPVVKHLEVMGKMYMDGSVPQPSQSSQFCNTSFLNMYAPSCLWHVLCVFFGCTRRPAHVNTFAFAEDLSFLGVFGAASNVVYSYAGARPSEIAQKKNAAWSRRMDQYKYSSTRAHTCMYYRHQLAVLIVKLIALHAFAISMGHEVIGCILSWWLTWKSSCLKAVSS